MTATFGTLQNEELRLGRGLNVIHAPNESGKSTWCAFLKAMLYGIDSSQREKSGQKPDKVKYAPWSGAPMEGVIELEAEGRSITLCRSTRNAAYPMRQFSAVYTGTGEAVPWLSSGDAGERLIGVPLSVYERSAFIRQSTLSLDNSPELEKRIAAMVTAGEEEVSFTEADERLRAWQRKRRFRNGGRLPELEHEIAELRGRIGELKKSVRELESMEELAESCRLRRDSLQSQVEESRRTHRKSVLERLSESRAGQNRLAADAEERRAAAGSLRSRLEASVFHGAGPEAIQGPVQADAREAGEAQRQALRLPSPILWIFPAVLGLLLLTLGALLTPYLYIPAGAALLTALWGAFAYIRRRRNAAAAGELCRAILSKYGVGEPDEIEPLLSSYSRDFAEYLRAEEDLRAAEAALAEAAARQKELEGRILQELDFETGDSEAAGLSRRLAETDRELRGLRENCAMARGRLDSLGDPMVLATQLQALEDEYEEQCRAYDALELAINVLREANAELQSRFSPRLARRTAELMAYLTGGRYTDLTLYKELDAMVRRAGDTIPHETAFLSRGACDQFYLALRLSLCELTLPRTPACPIVLDDALVNFDDERLGLALDLLEELSKQRQILLFTCQRREGDYLAWKKSAGGK
jgi:uncharacterized protein YhaN